MDYTQKKIISYFAKHDIKTGDMVKFKTEDSLKTHLGIVVWDEKEKNFTICFKHYSNEYRFIDIDDDYGAYLYTIENVETLKEDITDYIANHLLNKKIALSNPPSS